MLVLYLMWVMPKGWWVGPWTMVAMLEPLPIMGGGHPPAEVGLAMMIGGLCLCVGALWVKEQWFGD